MAIDYTYRVIEAQTTEALAKDVTFLMQSGWKLHGSPFYGSDKFYQAMTFEQEAQGAWG